MPLKVFALKNLFIFVTFPLCIFNFFNMCMSGATLRSSGDIRVTYTKQKLKRIQALSKLNENLSRQLLVLVMPSRLKSLSKRLVFIVDNLVEDSALPDTIEESSFTCFEKRLIHSFGTMLGVWQTTPCFGRDKYM